MTGNTLRVGILVNSPLVTAWQAYLIDTIATSNCVKVATLFQLSSEPLAARKRPRLFSLFERYGSRHYPGSQNALAETKLGAPDGLTIELTTLSVDRNNGGALTSTSQALVSSHDIDIFIVLGTLRLVDQLAALAHLGAFYFWQDNGGSQHTDGVTAGLFEVLHGKPCLRAELRLRLPSGNNECVAYKTWSAVRSLSYKHCNNQHLWKAAAFPVRALNVLCQNNLNTDCFEACASPHDTASDNGNGRFPLNFGSLFMPLCQYALARVKNVIISRLFVERWTTFFSNAAADKRGRLQLALQPSRLTELKSPEDRFWADPHLFADDGKTFIFFEDACMQTGLGRLSVLEVKNDGSVSDWKSILEEPHHLSYPFVFEWQNSKYMIPESGASGAVSLYRCHSFPYEWRFEHHLIEGITAFDATLFFHDGLWWMFANVISHSGACSWDELCLFYADNPLSTQWTAHRANPIVSDVRRSRPAGHLFRSEGKIYRPAQDSSFRYGYGMSIMEIQELSTEAFRETLAEQVLPTESPDIVATHTYNRDSNYLVVDAIVRKSKFK